MEKNMKWEKKLYFNVFPFSRENLFQKCSFHLILFPSLSLHFASKHKVLFRWSV